MRGALPQGLDEPAARAFVAAVQQNVVLPGDAAAWATIVFGDEAPQLDEEGAALLRAAGPGFFAAAVRAVDEHGDDWKAVTAAVRAATSRKGPDLFRPLRYALTGAGHGPELAPLLPLITAARARQRLLRFTH